MKYVEGCLDDPVPAWNVGCSIVALNYQTPSEAMWINEGKFSDNGRCGYLLKPDVLLSPIIPWDPKNAFPVHPPLVHMTDKLASHCDPRSPSS
jgi:hypothetical protein